MSEEKDTRKLISEAREYFARGINKWGEDRLDQVLTQLAAEQKDYKQAKSKLREIINLCSNCRSLGDAQCIAGGQENTSTESGCEKCWVEKLQAKLDAEQEEKEQLVKDTVTNLLCYILDNHEGEPLAERKLQEIGMSFIGSEYNKTVSQALAGKSKKEGEG